MERDVGILVETMALFVRFWLTITPPLPDSAQDAARARAGSATRRLSQALGRRLARGDRIVRRCRANRPREQPKPASVGDNTKTGIEPSARPPISGISSPRYDDPYGC